MKKNKRDLFSIRDEVAIVTGAAGQLGGEYVRALLGAGAYVAAFDVNMKNPKGNLRSLKSSRLIMLEVDITDKGMVEEGLKAVVRHFGPPTILINNAALDAPPSSTEQQTGSFESYSEGSWDSMMEVNLKGTFFCCQVVGGYMAKRRKGSIINISSIFGILSPDQRVYDYRKETFRKPVAYSVSKAGILNLTRYLATYWAKNNVRVNTLVLGGVYNDQDKVFLKNYTQKVPLGRMARQNEYNGSMLFLSSDASSYMTGSSMVIDGGYSCW
jgi:NAD(P)-dependent dehydrogenase (short-subunit alcohol dehydrogenase family)